MTITIGRRPVPTFDDVFDPRENAFGFLRLTLAAMVLVSHSFTLGGFGPEPLYGFTQNRTNLGTLAVMGFFAVSGFLITRSMTTVSSIVTFIWNRFLRIFPGFWCCHLLILVALVPLLCAIEHRDLADFLQTNWDAYASYARTNALLNVTRYDIAPLLSANPYKLAINGSLWSLIYEWHCYLVVMLLGVVTLWPRLHRWLALAFAAALWAASIQLAHGHEPAPFLPSMLWSTWMIRLGPYFFVSGALYLFRRHVPYHLALFVVAAALLAFALHDDLLCWLGPPTMAYTVLYLAMRLPRRLAWFDRAGDVSYGVYIYAFPIQQTLAALHVQAAGVVPYVALSFALTVGVAILSFRFIEKPALKLKKVDPTFGLESRLQKLAGSLVPSRVK